MEAAVREAETLAAVMRSNVTRDLSSRVPRFRALFAQSCSVGILRPSERSQRLRTFARLSRNLRDAKRRESAFGSSSP